MEIRLQDKQAEERDDNENLQDYQIELYHDDNQTHHHFPQGKVHEKEEEKTNKCQYCLYTFLCLTKN